MVLPDDIACIRAPNPSLMTGQGTNTYLVSGPSSTCAVIDPGPQDEPHLARVADAARVHGDLQAILITHGHPDHVGGAVRLRELTGAPIMVHRAGDQILGADRIMDDGDTLMLGGRRLVALHTPGHRSDHLCFLLPDTRTLFAGDLVAGNGTVVIAPPEGELLAYLTSLRRLLTFEITRILPGHGPPIERPRDLLEQYLRHRQEREQQILASLAAGPLHVDELVSVIYAGVDPALHVLAARTVTAHLLKLQGEVRVGRSHDSAGNEVWRSLDASVS